ncbi:piezo-type mechanosensitive ion channel component 1-like protein, partial [Lates japonicus]
ICFLMTVNVIGQRMNFLVIIHGCWLVAILVRRRRAAIVKIWPKYCLFLSIFMIYQYLLCVGIPPALCIDYPWRWNTQVLMNSALIKWIYLPDFYTVPNSKNLIADFVLLMCASQQWKVFECEHTEEWMVLAGENTDDPDPMEGRLFNPAPNFINCRGFELFKASIVKNIKFHQQAEKKSLSQLKRSMQRIRSKQQKCRDGHKTSEESNESQTAESQKDMKKSRKKKWHRPWLNHATVLHSGEYYLFESDSEDEEELQSEEQRPQKQTACQLAYQAWVTSVKTALKERHGEMVQRILDILRFLWAIILAIVDGLTQWLNLLTKQYRETSTVLCNERYFIIHKIQQHHTTADSTDDQLSQGSESPTLETCLDETDAENSTRYSCMEVDSRGVTGRCTPRPRLNSTENFLSPEPPSSSMELVPEPSKQQHRHSRTASELLGDRQFFIEELEQCREFYNNQNRLLKLLFAMYNLLAANSELVCYFIIVLNNVVSASVISLVLPILVFLWAMLAVPRPTKKFWMTAIVYTEVMVVVKYLFQFGFFPWNSVYEMTLNEDKPFFPPRILGLEKTDNYIKYDLLQLLALFFHRSLLMRYGLWDHEGPLEEQSPSPESCEDKGKTREGGEDGRRQEAGGEEEEEGRVCSTSTLDNLDMTELDQLEKDDVDYVERSASSAAAVPQPSAAEPEPPEPLDGQDTLNPPSWPREDKMEGDNDDVPKKSSSIRFRRKPKQPKQQRSKECLGANSGFLPVDILTLSIELPLMSMHGDVIDFIIRCLWLWAFGKFNQNFVAQLCRETEKKYPQPKGQKKKKIVKYGMGGLIIFFLICIIWFPLLFISLVRSVVGVVNHPIDVTVTVKLGGYEPLFTMSVQQQSIQPFTEDEYEQLTKTFGDKPVAMQFITLYSYEDIVTAMIEGSSGSVWRISPPSRQEVIKELLGSPVDLTLRLAWTFQRDLGKGGTVEHTFDKHSIDLEPGNPVRADLASLLVGNRTEPVHVPNMFPNYIRAPNGAEAKPVNQLYEGNEDGYLNITLSLMSDRSLNDSRNQEWWDIAIAGCKPSSCGVLPMVIFNDKVSPPSLGFLAGYG